MKLIANLLPIFFILILVVVFFGKTLTGQQIFVTPDFGTSDVLYYEYSTKFFLSESLKHGQLPLWNPFIAAGFPQLGTITGYFNPINLILFKFIPMPAAFNLGLALSFLITAIFTYLFTRSLGLSKIASLFSATAFTFSGFLITQIVHFNLIQTLSFFLVELYLTEVFIQKRRTVLVILLAFAVGFQILSGFYQLVLYSIIVLIFYIAWRVLFLKESGKQKVFLLAIPVLAIFAGFLVAAIQLISSWELTQLSTREGGVTTDAVRLFPYPVKHLITLIWPYLLGDPRVGTYPSFSQNWGIFWESTGFIGIFPLILAFLAIAAGMRNNLVKFFLILAFFSLLLMLGKNSPTFFLFQIPPLSFFRVPARWIVFFIFSLTILAGVGLEFVRQKLAHKIKPEAILLFIILLIATINVFIFALNYHLRGNVKKWLSPPSTVEFLTKDQSTYRIFTLGNQEVWNEQFIKKGWLGAENKFLAFNEGLDPNWNVVFGIDSSSSNATILTKRDALMRSILFQNIGEQGQSIIKDVSFINPVAKKILDVQNVKYIISAANIAGNDLELVFTSQTQPKYYIYENKTVLPRVFIVSQVILARTAQEQYQILASKSFNPKSTAIVENKLPKTLFESTSSQAEITSYGNQNIEIKAKMEGEGILVLADSFYPGWKATVDGQETEILAANINQRTVVVPTGEHIVKFSFEPKSFRIGALITLATSAILMTILLFSLLKSRSQVEASTKD